MHEPDDFLNLSICYAFVLLSLSATLVIYSTPLPHFIKRKFRFK